MAELAILWCYVLWPLLVGAGISVAFRKHLSGIRDVLLVIVVVYGLKGIFQVPYEITRLILLVDHSPNWMNYNPIMFYGSKAGEALALLLSLLLCKRIAQWAGTPATGA